MDLERDLKRPLAPGDRPLHLESNEKKLAGSWGDDLLRRGGLRTPGENGIAFARACPPWALGSSITPGDHDTPRFAAGLTTRTRRARPSEKITFRAVSPPSPLGDPRRVWPRRGGAGSPRPRGRPGLGRGVFLLGHLRFACLPGLMRGLDLRRGLRTRARWTHASENPTFPTPLACPPGLKPGGHRPYVPLSAK